MKVSVIWRIAFAVSIGFALGGYVTGCTFLKNLPPTTEISIGKVKLRGTGNTIEKAIEVTPTKRVRRRDR